MLILPLIIIVAGYIIYHLKYKIDKELFDKIVLDLVKRGDLKTKEPEGSAQSETLV